jgi:Mrp family chromosome partitioning ATPase
MAELGLALAESGRDVILLNTDIRSSALPGIFDVPNDTGLTNVLLDGEDPRVFIRHPRRVDGVELSARVAERLAVIPSGGSVAEALSLLDSEEMARALTSLRESHYFVLLDSPAVTEAADAFALAVEVDGVMVVCSEGKATGRGVTPIGGILVSKKPGGRAYAQAPPERPPQENGHVTAAVGRETSSTPVSNGRGANGAVGDLAKRVP